MKHLHFSASVREPWCRNALLSLPRGSPNGHPPSRTLFLAALAKSRAVPDPKVLIKAGKQDP